MNIFHRVTLQSLKKNRTRTIVTIIGIILSTALICAVTTSISSFLDYMKRNIIYQDGNWQGSVLGADFDSYNLISDSGEISDSVFAQQIGYAKIESDNSDKPYMYVLGADKNFAETVSIHLTSGRLPENENEIILPGHLASNGGLAYTVGDTIELEIGQRIDSDGYVLGQNNPYRAYDDNGNPVDDAERIEVNAKRTFTVVGLFQRPGFEGWSAPGFTAITAPDMDNMESVQYDVYFSMKKPKDIYKFIEKNHLDADTNNELLACMGVVKYEGFTNVLYSLAAFVILLIMFGSVSLIYNAFSISVSERTKQFGLLSSIGATKKQLRRTVFFEAGIVSLIGIPLGILVGIAGIGTTLTLISDKFDTFTGQASGAVKMKLCVSLIAVVIACIVALVTVLISAWIPSKRATKISAVEAIRQSNDIKAEKRAIKTPKIIGKVFGLPGLLAHKYYKRSKKKYRATVVSLFMSIVLFIPSTAFTGYLVDMADSAFNSYGYDLVYRPEWADLSGFDKDDVLKTVRNEETVDYAVYTNNINNSASIDGKYLSDEMKDFFPAYEENGVPINLCFVNDDEFIKLLDENHLKKEDFMNPESPQAVAIDNLSSFDYEKQKMLVFNGLASDKCEAEFNMIKKVDGYYFETYYYDEEDNEYIVYRNNDDPEDSLKIKSEEACTKTNLKSEKTLHKTPFFVENYGNIAFIYPYSAKDVIIPENAEIGSYFSIRIQSENHSDCYTALKGLIDSKLLPAGDITDYAEMAEADRNIVTIVQVFAYGFIVLISLIAAANVFNTISTNISLRRREFAMLKSIGMTGKGFNRMMNFECVLYGIKSLLYGLPVSIAITYWIYHSVSEGFVTNFQLPWKAIAIAVSSVFIVVFATMMYSMSKIKKDNPIDALKNENI